MIPSSQSKTKVSIAIPLNSDAISILRQQLFKHSEFFFTYKDIPIKQCNTKAWRKALKRAGIEIFVGMICDIHGHLGMCKTGLL